MKHWTVAGEHGHSILARCVAPVLRMTHCPGGPMGFDKQVRQFEPAEGRSS